MRAFAWKLCRHASLAGDVACLERLLGPDAGVTSERVEALLAELAGSPELQAAFATDEARRWAAAGPDPFTFETQTALAGTGRGRALLLYVTTRLARPEIVVETGCFTGWDSAVILAALRANGSGRLTSIDLPARGGQFSQLADRPRAGLLPGLEPGFLVPEELRDRWTLIVGDVREELPPLLERLGRVDLFFHDSDHTYAHMIWEYATAWRYLAPGGLLVSDDISWNPSIRDFAAGIGVPLVIHRRSPNVGALAAPRGAARPVGSPERARELVAS